MNNDFQLLINLE